MAKPIHVSEQEFRSEVLEASAPVLVDFWAEWCGPCRMIAPVLEQIGDEQGDTLKIVKVDVDANPGVASAYGVFSIPTMLLFKGGEPAERLVGYMPKQALLSKLSKHLQPAAAR
jgi:thioredoxin 1